RSGDGDGRGDRREQQRDASAACDEGQARHQKSTSVVPSSVLAVAAAGLPAMSVAAVEGVQTMLAVVATPVRAPAGAPPSVTVTVLPERTIVAATLPVALTQSPLSCSGWVPVRATLVAPS